MNKEEAECVIYMINEIANKYNAVPSEVYDAMKKTGCIKDYLVPFYDVVHTMGTQRIAEDIIEYMSLRGVKI